MYKCVRIEIRTPMGLVKVNPLRAFVLLVLLFSVSSGILQLGFIDFAIGQPATGPGGTPTSAPNTTTGPGGTPTSAPNTTTGPGGTPTSQPENATGSVLATTTTKTSTFSYTKGGFQILTTLTNTTTVSPVQP
jgi:hypothetical protein